MQMSINMEENKLERMIIENEVESTWKEAVAA
jgi:hypothetical protein